MIRVSQRAAEPGEIEATTRGSFGGNMLKGGLPVAMAMGGIVYLVSKSWIAAGGAFGLLLALSAFSNARYFSDQRRRRRVPVEVMEVEASAAWEVEGDFGPTVCFDLGDGRGLLLSGEWLRQPELYGAPRPEDDGPAMNGLDDPFRFPATKFLILRSLDNDQPFRIRIDGPALAPAPARAPTLEDPGTPVRMFDDFRSVIRPRE